MWAWRTLHPDKPFNDGKPYGTARKFIVLMTDGENMISANNKNTSSQTDNGAPYSDYTAYGYLWQKRLGTNNFNQAALALDGKLTQACNAAKAQGITVMTILFRESSQRAINNVRDCASRPDLFFRASDKASLDQAFQDVAGQISHLRISD